MEVRVRLGAAIVAAVVLVISVASPRVARVAHACGNAVVLEHDARVKRLREAQVALDDGDFELARELAREAGEAGEEDEVAEDVGDERTALGQRATRILALADVRDARASEAEKRAAAEALESLRGGRRDDVVLAAAHGEALARVPGREGEAFAVLAPLLDRDLLGSPFALGALHRLASGRGDARTAAVASSRCLAMAGDGRVCRGDYQARPLLRGKAIAYEAPAAVIGLALALRLLRRRGSSGRDRARVAPWEGHAAKLHAAAILAAGLHVFARPTAPVSTTLALAAVLLLGPLVERRLFFSAVRAGKIAGYALRPTGPDDAHLPPLSSFFVAFFSGTGARMPETLERVPEAEVPGPGYRDASRVPLLRVVPLPSHGSRARPRVVAAAVIAAMLLVTLAASAMVFMTFARGV